MQLDQITFTRFVAALTVVFFHYGQTVFPANIPFLHENLIAGPIAVGYFYVLSGFIMAIAYYHPVKEKQRTINKRKYWIARFARIYPVYLLALLIIVAAKVKTLPETWDALVLHLFLLQSWIPGYPITLNTPGWSLSVEAFFYFCLPFLVLWVYKHGTKTLTLFAIVLWLATQLLVLVLLNSDAYAPKNHLHDFIFYNPLMHLNSFVAGLLVGIYFKNNAFKEKNNNQTAWNSWNNNAGVVISFCIIYLLIWARPHLEQILGIKLAFTNGLLAPFFLLFLVYLASNKGAISRLLSHKWMILLGEASYSLYILQKPAHGLYDKIIVPRIALSETIHFYIFVILLIAASILSYKYFETPMRRYIRRKLA